MTKFNKVFSSAFTIIFLFQNVAFCALDVKLTLRAPSRFNKSTKDFIKSQYVREKDGKFGNESGGSWEDVLDTIIGSLRLLDLATNGKLTIAAYRAIDKRVSLSTNRRDFKRLVDLGYLVCDTSGKEYLYEITDKFNSIIRETFVYKLHSMRHYPQNRKLKFYESTLKKQALMFIEKILDNMDNSVVFMLDIDETLVDSKRHPKIIEDLKDLLSVLRSRNHIVGIVTHRAAMIQELDANDEKSIVLGIHKAKQYVETQEDLAKLGVAIDDFDFFVIGGLTPELGFVNYIRVNNRWAKGEKDVIERIVPIDAPFKATKIASISQVDDIFRNEFGLKIFNGAYLVPIDDDLYQGHSLMHGQPHIAEHLIDVERIFLQMKDSVQVQETLKRIKKFGGIIIPHINRKDNTLSFFNTRGARQFEILTMPGQELGEACFALEIAILRQLQALTKSGNEKVILNPKFPILFIDGNYGIKPNQDIESNL